MVGNAGEHVGEPGAWINVIQLGRHDQRIHGGCPFPAAIAARKEPRLPAKGYRGTILPISTKT
jgi:hypothetical protein